MELSKTIKRLRTEKGWSQETLAEKAYVSRQTISNWENEKNYPDVHSLLILSNLFGVSLDELIKGDVETMKNTIHNKDASALKHRIWKRHYSGWRKQKKSESSIPFLLFYLVTFWSHGDFAFSLAVV